MSKQETESQKVAFGIGKFILIGGFIIITAIGALSEQKPEEPVDPQIQRERDLGREGRYECRHLITELSRFPNAADISIEHTSVDLNLVTIDVSAELMNGLGLKIPQSYQCKFIAEDAPSTKLKLLDIVRTR